MTERSLAGHLVLVGLPGAGKTTVGRLAAGLLGVPFLDFDEEIERREGRTVADIFAADGEGAFRAMERALTAELRDAAPMVLAPGGGWITNPDVVALLRPPGRIIHLRVTPIVALARLGAARQTRPLLRGPDPEAALRHLYEARSAAYARADAVLDVEVFPAQELARQVAELARGGREG